MSNHYITENEFDRLSDFDARNYVYCHHCKMYHRRGSECLCGLQKQIKIIKGDRL